jgi:hypothetical protein
MAQNFVSEFVLKEYVNLGGINVVLAFSLNLEKTFQ